MTDKPRGCKAKNAQGEPCGMHPRLVDQVSQLCDAHAQNSHQEMSRRGSQGGRATREKWVRPGVSKEELGPLKTIADAQRWIRILTVAVASGRIDKGDAQIAIRGCEIWMRGQDSLTEKAVLELADLADEIKDELKVKANRGQA